MESYKEEIVLYNDNGNYKIIEDKQTWAGKFKAFLTNIEITSSALLYLPYIVGNLTIVYFILYFVHKLLIISSEASLEIV